MQRATRKAYHGPHWCYIFAVLRWLTILATAGMIAVNGLANALPINGKTTGEISNGYDILFTPAGYVFSIWGLIYLGLIGFAIVQALPSRKDDPVIESVRPWYLLNTAANAGWIVAWHYELVALSLVVMLVILGSLVTIYLKVAKLSLATPVSFAAVRVPFSLYFAWICIATIANLTVLLWTLGATELLSDPTATLIIVVAATALGSAISLRAADPAVAGVFVWAIYGIASKNAEAPMLSVGASVCAGVCAAAGLVALVMAIKHSPAKQLHDS